MTNGVRSLLRDYVKALDALQESEIVRSKNSPIADYAEWLIARTLGLTLCAKSTKGYDASDRLHRYEIKARRLTSSQGSRQLSAIRSLERSQFDFLVGVLFQADLSVERVAVIPIDIVRSQSTHRTHTNSAVFFLRESVWQIDGVRDITADVRRIESAL